MGLRNPFQRLQVQRKSLGPSEKTRPTLYHYHKRVMTLTTYHADLKVQVQVLSFLPASNILWSQILVHPQSSSPTLTTFKSHFTIKIAIMRSRRKRRTALRTFIGRKSARKTFYSVMEIVHLWVRKNFAVDFHSHRPKNG